MTDAGALAGLPPLRDVIAACGLQARKALGQNFLFDLNLTRRIARAGGPLAGSHVVEIGPGPGGLTRALLLEGADHVTAIERDSRALPALAAIADAAPGRLSVIHADALGIEIGTLAEPGRPLRIVANLPYNVATPLLVGWLTSAWPPAWASMTLLFQREVAERIVAPVGGKTYGRLSVLAQWRATARLLFDIPPQAFTPPPKIVSSVVRFEPRGDAAELRPAIVEAVTAAAFGQRRKMLRASLRRLVPDPAAVLREAGIDAELRAEQVPVDGLLRLAAAVEALSPPIASRPGRG